MKHVIQIAFNMSSKQSFAPFVFLPSNLARFCC